MVAVVACMHSASQQSSTGPVTHKEGGVLQAQVVGHEVRVIGWSRALFCKGKGAHQGRQAGECNYSHLDTIGCSNELPPAAAAAAAAAATCGPQSMFVCRTSNHHPEGNRLRDMNRPSSHLAVNIISQGLLHIGCGVVVRALCVRKAKVLQCCVLCGCLGQHSPPPLAAAAQHIPLLPEHGWPGHCAAGGAAGAGCEAG
eukprot:1153412-Pelagomonas_calceolata.AAC.1